MQNLFSNMLLWKKFLVLGIVIFLLFIIPTTLYTWQGYDNIRQKDREISGLMPAVSVINTMKLLQQHRGMTAMLLNGNKNVAENRKKKSEDIYAAFQTLTEAVTAVDLTDKTIADNNKKWGKTWAELAAAINQQQLSAPQSFTQHNALINGLFTLQNAILNDFNMTTDASLDSNQLIRAALVYLPLLTDEMGKIRAQGASILTNKKITVQNRLVITMLLQRINEQYANMNEAFQTAFKVNTYLTVNTQIDEALNTAQTAMEQALHLVKTEILDQDDTTRYQADEYFNALTKAIDLQLKVSDLSVEVLHENLLYQRMQLYRQIGSVLVGILCLGMLALLIILGISASVTKPMSEAVRMAKSVALLDLTARASIVGKDEAAQLLHALNKMSDSLIHSIQEIYNTIGQINKGAAEIAKGNLDLSGRTESQAANLEETASSMDEITMVVKQNTDRVMEADKQANLSADMADQGGKSVTGIVDTMKVINDSSQKIVDIIAVIDGIAFQTNILALNAAVEAARAGEQGRGFAVVAAEVRNLAQKSSTAAKDIKDLITSSVDKINTGNTQAAEAGAAIQEIIPIVKAVAKIMRDITQANHEQSNGMVQINASVNQMESITQQNAALVEQAAAASQHIQEQVGELLKAVGQFKIS